MAKQKQIDPEELRYHYLGFDVVPGKIKEFWKSEEEKKTYLEKVRARLKKTRVIERDFSVVNSRELNKGDRIAISVASVLTFISLFVPYYSFEAYGHEVSGSALSYLFHLGYVSNFVAWGSLAMKIMFVLSLIMIIFSPVVGALNLVALNTGLNKHNYFERLKKISKLNILFL